MERMWLGIVAVVIVAVVVVGGIAASQEAPSQAAQEEKRGAICNWCASASAWYSGLPWYKKAWYVGWLATSKVYCLGNGCGW
jgi:hypothetical protein